MHELEPVLFCRAFLLEIRHGLDVLVSDKVSVVSEDDDSPEHLVKHILGKARQMLPVAVGRVDPPPRLTEIDIGLVATQQPLAHLEIASSHVAQLASAPSASAGARLNLLLNGLQQLSGFDLLFLFHLLKLDLRGLVDSTQFGPRELHEAVHDFRRQAFEGGSHSCFCGVSHSCFRGSGGWRGG
eukprot:jgi/Mesvir1/19701/Mv25178-RA.1